MPLLMPLRMIRLMPLLMPPMIHLPMPPLMPRMMPLLLASAAASKAGTANADNRSGSKRSATGNPCGVSPTNTRATSSATPRCAQCRNMHPQDLGGARSRKRCLGASKASCWPTRLRSCSSYAQLLIQLWLKDFSFAVTPPQLLPLYWMIKCQ